MTWKRIAAGDYESADGNLLLYCLMEVYPPAWNVEDKRTCRLLVDGAATKRDAITLAAERTKEEK